MTIGGMQLHTPFEFLTAVYGSQWKSSLDVRVLPKDLDQIPCSYTEFYCDLIQVTSVNRLGLMGLALLC